jgi:hypothetical protein
MVAAGLWDKKQIDGFKCQLYKKAFKAPQKDRAQTIINVNRHLNPA